MACCLGAVVWLTARTANTQQAATPVLVPPPAASPQVPGKAAEAASLPTRPANSPFHITGVVIDSVTNAPIANATLSTAPMNTMKQNRGPRRFQSATNSATSDADGHFDLTVASAGGWELTASARNYRPQPLDEHDGYSTAVILTESAPRMDITFRLTPGAIVEGFVLDEAGEAVRGANVALLYVPPATPDNQHPRPRNRAQQMTDDRGFYKFGTLVPGSYEVRVIAQPWYATSRSGAGSRPRADTSDSSGAVNGPDPLDVVYPTVWYPGTQDPAAATPIILHGGETQEASFKLLPVPGSHLHIAAANDSAAGREGRPSPPSTYLTRLLPDGSEDASGISSMTYGNGSTDIAGLAPGTYLVHQQSALGSTNAVSTIQVGAGSPRTLELNEGAIAPTVTVVVDSAADQNSLQISFEDVESGRVIYAQRLQDFGRQALRRRGQQSDDSASGPAAKPDRTASLPPGKYQVFLNGVGDLHLSGIDATGASATGRLVTIGSGPAKLLLHTSAGRGTVTGIVSYQGQPDAGAMVLLIPATLGDPAGLAMPSRDQTNTDGSFEMTNLLPGQYILVAIDHGWDVNWADATTLRRYLLHGVPLDIKAGSEVKRAAVAQSP